MNLHKSNKLLAGWKRFSSSFALYLAQCILHTILTSYSSPCWIASIQHNTTSTIFSMWWWRCQGDENCWASAPNIAPCAKVKFGFGLFRPENFFQHVSWFSSMTFFKLQIRFHMDFFSNRLLLSQLCGVFELWLSCEQLLLFEMWISSASSELPWDSLG